jgi:hypothetical protein
VRILLEQNLSPRLIRALADILPGLESVYDHGLTGSSDPLISDRAGRADFAALVSTDRDFVALADDWTTAEGLSDRAMRFSIPDNRTHSQASSSSKRGRHRRARGSLNQKQSISKQHQYPALLSTLSEHPARMHTSGLRECVRLNEQTEAFGAFQDRSAMTSSCQRGPFPS